MKRDCVPPTTPRISLSVFWALVVLKTSDGISSGIMGSLPMETSVAGSPCDEAVCLSAVLAPVRPAPIDCT